MGHAGAIISGGNATATAKQQALREAGVTVVPTAADIADGIREATGWNQQQKILQIISKSSSTFVLELFYFQEKIFRKFKIIE